MKATLRELVVKWGHDGFTPEQIARQTHLPIDEIRSVLWSTTPKPRQPKRPEFIQPPAFND